MEGNDRLRLGCYQSPIGTLYYVFDHEKERLVELAIGEKPRSHTYKEEHFPLLDKALMSYFAGRFGALAHVPITLSAPPFSKKVLETVMTIKAGHTTSYAQIAKMVNNPLAARAVGNALASNKIVLVVPCHRVVPSTGAPGNYRYGRSIKAWLLSHEAGGTTSSAIAARSASPYSSKNT
jgi:methylated-DNA-[protein]-cysteine S-methyltransferase